MRALVSTRLEAQLAEARLEALRAQLNPHFLFNALNATSVMAMSGERESVGRMLGAIADLLRVALDKKLPQEVPLARELVMVDSYIAIQTARFFDRLTVRKEIDPEALAGLVPSMLLQPLVENAVEHGVASRPGAGSVSIHARREAEILRIEVRDDGPGFGSHPGPGRVESGNGIGLGNTRARLEHLYGSGHQLTTGNLQSGGAFVAVSVPWRPAAEVALSTAPVAAD
jgi:sensor histidine kinase YesM